MFKFFQTLSLRQRCLIYLVLTACLWSTSGVIVKSVNWNAMAIASGRSLAAGLTVFFLLGGPPSLKGLNRGHWMAGLMLALVSVTFITATKMTTAANAILLQYTAPVWVAIFAPIFLKEKTHGRDWLFIGIIFGGMALFFMDSLSPQGLKGNLIAILSGVIFAALTMFIRNLKDADPAKSAVVGNFMAFAIGLYFWRAPWPDPISILLIILAGVFQFGLSYFLYSKAARGVTSMEMVLISTIEPILNPIWVFWAVGERPGPNALAGGGLVLAAVTAWSILKSKRADAREPASDPVNPKVD